jgi:hypothetical protein
MVRSICAAACLQVLAMSPAMAQPRPPWKILGDTTGSPRGCSAAAGIAAISAWFAAFNNADSLALARATPPRGERFGVFSTGRFVPNESFVRIESLVELVRYARVRARRHEHMTIQGVRFYRWRRRALGFMPYFSRSADDLGPRPLAGIGKGEYSCGKGIHVLNLAPKPPSVPGLAARSRPHRLTNVAADKHFSDAATPQWL